MVTYVIFFFCRINWPELLDHPFWTQVIKEEDEANIFEENKHSEKGERNRCDEDGLVNLRCGDAIFLCIKDSPQLQIFFVDVVLLHVKFVYSL